MIIEEIQQRASQRNAIVAMADAMDPRVVEAAQALESKGICKCILVNDSSIDDHNKLADHLLNVRGGKGLTQRDAEELSHNQLFITAWLVHTGRAAAAVGGSLSTTADVIRAGLWTIGQSEETSVVSSFFLMVWPENNRVLTYADCGVVPNPTSIQLADIAYTSAVNHANLTNSEPRVAFLSFSTKGSANHPDVLKVIEAHNYFENDHPEIISDGELQVDAAIVPLVAHSKAPESPVAGMANVLIFPTLDAGNIAYKLTQRLAGAEAIGPIIQGLKKPFVDLSRGCVPEDIVNAAAIALLLK